PSAIFQGLQDHLRFNVLRALTPSIYCVGLLLLFQVRQQSLEEVLGALSFAYVAALLIGGAMVWRTYAPTWKWSKGVVSRLMHFGYRSQATSLTSTFNQRIDQVMLSLFVPPEQLGYYAVAVSLSAAIIVFPQAAGIVTFSKGSSQQHGDAVATMGTALRASFIWLLVTCSVLYLLADFLIRHVFGNAFEGSILACRILIPGALMMGMNQVLYNGASALGRPGLPAVAEGVSMLATAVGLFLLVPHYGYIGAAIVSSIAYTISFFVMLFLAHRFLAIDLRTLLLPRGAGLRDGASNGA
ncbi:MAG: polysaccharide biosynthesis C-terminal domain-containing protein, partial [Terracidiphilus sp.]